MNVPLIKLVSWNGTNVRIPATSSHVEKDLVRSLITKEFVLALTDTFWSTTNAKTSTSVYKIHVMTQPCARTHKETLFVHVLKDWSVTRFEVAVEIPANASPTPTVPTRLFARTQNAEIPANQQMHVVLMQSVAPLDTQFPVNVPQRL